jgi:hypothetical protein
MMLEQPYHECDDPDWESTGLIVFEDCKAEFKYDCMARELTSGYNYRSSRMVGQSSTPCGATTREYLTAVPETSTAALEAVEAAGADIDDSIEVYKCDPPTPEDPNGVLWIGCGHYDVTYK